MDMKRLTLTFTALFVAFMAMAGENEAVTATETAKLKDSVRIEEKGVRKNRFMPMLNRVDREIDKNTYAYKGEIMMGATVSYGTLSSDDTDFYLILDNINLKGTVVTVNPYIGYFVADDNVIGVRFGYSYLYGSLGNVNLNLGEENDIEFSLGNMSLKRTMYSFGVFHRSYVALDPRGRFGVFSEVELLAETGTQTFAYKSGDAMKESTSDIFRAKLNFNPGIAVYIFPNVCGSISFGLGGLQYNHIKQHNELGEKTGSRSTSKMRFRLNLADIRVGMTVHLWNKKKTLAR